MRTGLIPAWAGKTKNRVSVGKSAPAHPRVGGENIPPISTTKTARGSSPRGRGKPRGPPQPVPRERLIPAWAGKTVYRNILMLRDGAHPRVGGENAREELVTEASDGSSPRGRGKLVLVPRASREVRLIPAWAGKTIIRPDGAFTPSAHPRVGGENTSTPAPPMLTRGSSPRGRGKHFLTCAFIKRIGQILETLELAVSSGSYSLCDVYATDAPQDQARNTGLALPSSRAAS